MKKLFKNKFIKISILLSIFIFFLTIFFLKYEKKYHTSIPFELTDTNRPVIKIKIENKIYSIDFNLGTQSPFSLNKSILENISNKTFKKNVLWRNIKGDICSSSSYIIPKFQIEDMIFKNAIIWEENRDHKNFASFNDNKEKINEPIGKIGAILREYNLLFDYQKNKFFISNDKTKLKKLGYDLKKFIKIPFETTPFGIKLKSYSDLGIKYLILTTGSTYSIIKPTPFLEKICEKKYDLNVFTTTKFVIGNIIFNYPQDFFLFDFYEEDIRADGLLGMDFLSRYTFYMDFKNKTLHLGD